MFKSKVYRLFCFLFAFSLVFALFGVEASAASDSENLIDSNLTNWEKYNPDFTSVSVPFYDGDSPVYQITFKPIKIDDADFWLRNGALYDISNLKAGSSYTFNFHLYDYNELTKLGFSSSEAWLYNGLLQYGGTLVVGLGYYSPTDDTVYGLDDYAFYITKDNYKDYYGRDNTFSFVMPNIQNACIMIGYIDVYETGNTVPFYVSNFSLVDNEQVKEDNFLSKLFAWFQEKFDSIGESFTNLGNEIKQGLVDLKNDLINGIKSLFVPDEEFMEDYSNRWEELIHSRLGAVAQVSGVLYDFFDSIIEYSGSEQNIITVPAVTLPLPDNASFTFGGFDVELVNEKFVFLQNACKVLVGILATFSFVYGLRKRYDEVMGVEQ